MKKIVIGCTLWEEWADLKYEFLTLLSGLEQKKQGIFTGIKRAFIMVQTRYSLTEVNQLLEDVGEKLSDAEIVVFADIFDDGATAGQISIILGK